MQKLTIIIKPTNACNASCIYCSAFNQDVKNCIMSRDVLENLFCKLVEYSKISDLSSVNFTWHGGEPLLVGPEFYETVVSLQEKYFAGTDLKYGNNMQSNLLLYDEKWDTVLRKLLITDNDKPAVIGSSYEPLSGLRLLKGEDYAPLWRERIAALEKAGFNWGIVYVATKKAIGQEQFLFDRFTKDFPGRSVRINPLYKEGRGKFSDVESYFLTPDEWTDLLYEFYKLWDQDNKKYTIAPLIEWDRFHYRGEFALACDLSGRCRDTHLGVDSDGMIYGCGRWIDNHTNAYGNILKDSIRDILYSQNRLKIFNRKSYLQLGECGTCKWLNYCNSGCPINPLLEDKSLFDMNPLCDSTRGFLEKVYGEPAPHAINPLYRSLYASAFPTHGDSNDKDNQLIHIMPADNTTADDLHGRLVIYGDDPDKINTLLEKYGERVLMVYYQGETRTIADLKSIDSVIYYFGYDDQREIILHHKHLVGNRRFMTFQDTKDILEKIKFVTSLNIKVDLIHLISRLSPEEIRSIIEFYLFDPTSKTSIDPFHTILSGMIKKFNLNLWDMTMQDARKFIHYGADGAKVSRGSQLPRHSLHLDPSQALLASDLEISEYFNQYIDNSKTEREKCTVCRYYYLCRGWADYGKNDCEKWLMIFKILQHTANEINSAKQAMRQYKAPVTH